VGRPGLVVVVTGTGTEVGKTWVASGLLAELRARGLTVSARKPVQSGDAGSVSGGDAGVLAASSGQDPLEVCPPHRRYGVALAPPMAASEEGRPELLLSDLVDEARVGWTGREVHVGLIEGAGGAASPIAGDGDTVDLARALQADLIVVVADAGLGVIHAVRAAVAWISRLEGDHPDVVVHLNRFDPADRVHSLSRAWLTQRDRLLVTSSLDTLADVVDSRVTGR
jgi:dethiobiotin synthetase